MKETKNKGEWTELLVFVKLLSEKMLQLSDKELNPTDNFFKIQKVTTHNLDLEFFILDNHVIQLRNKISNETKNIDLSNVLTSEVLNNLKTEIQNGKGASFVVSAFKIIQEKLEFSTIKGGTSLQKADIVLDISNSNIKTYNR